MMPPRRAALAEHARVIAASALAGATRSFASAARGLAAFVLPQRCPGCGAAADPARLLCDPCLETIPRLSFALCASCLVRDREPVGCRRHRRPVWPAWVYDPRAACVVQTLKYGERPGLARALGEALHAALPPPAPFDLVIEVPLHPARRRERGYNQAGLLADALAERLGVPRLERALERVRPTPPQARLDARARRENLAGAFRARHPRWLAGREVLIVDDVLTTGATFEACFAALEIAGARAVGVALAWAQ